MKKKYWFFFAAIIFSCNNAGNENSVTVTNKEYPDDTSSYSPQKITKPGGKAFSGPDSSVFDNDKEENIKRREAVYMGIDSTYYAIHEIEAIKNEIADESSVSLSVSERNIKSKAILKLNIIQNSLARQVDSALLINLRLHTKELASINNSISTNAGRLKDISVQVNKAAAIMNRLTDILAFCISKGLVKPPTPIKSSPDKVKAAVAQ